MQKKVEKILGEGPYAFPLDNIEKIIDIFSNGGIHIVVSKAALYAFRFQGLHMHNSYEFIFPESPMPFMQVGSETIPVQRDMMLPINPGHLHGPADDMPCCSFTALHIDTEYMLEIARQVYCKQEAEFPSRPQVPEHNLIDLLNLFIREAKNRQPGYMSVLESLSVSLTAMILRSIANDTDHTGQKCSQINTGSMDRVIEFMKENIDKEYSCEKAASLVNLSTYHFIRAFRKETGKTPYRYLTDLKIKRAMEMLKTPDKTITEICFLCGFSSHSHFSAVFKEKTGFSPSGYRREILESGIMPKSLET